MRMRYFISLAQLFVTTALFGQTLVLPGDFPDPSVIRHGNSYWATATTSNWAPAFPLLESQDLIHWELRGHVFARLPEWADYYFWAPEISHDNGKFYVYYSAHKRGGNLCIGVASADNPEGPYTDHGPLMCQEAGSIDAWPMRDENGKLYLIWKEDGNSVKKPTPIWAAEMNEARTKISDDKIELFRNDAPWEANLVEGVSMIHHGDYFYAFYAGAGCCGRGCSYETGVARAKHLLGPWEKFAGNPLAVVNDAWKCPGHGTPVMKDGRYFFLYHAYNSESNVYAGRQGMLSEFRFTDDGWIEFLKGVEGQATVQTEWEDDFKGKALSPHWQWSVFQKPAYSQRKGKLELMAASGKSGAYLGAKTLTSDYSAEAILLPTASSAEVGLGLIGDEKNFVTATVDNSQLVLRKVEDDKETVIEEKHLPRGKQLHLRVIVRGGSDISFLYSTDGKNFIALNESPVAGAFLPPWDRAVRVALVSKGAPSDQGVFDYFVLKSM